MVATLFSSIPLSRKINHALRKQRGRTMTTNTHYYDELPDDGAYRNFYYDFQTEIELSDWEVLERYTNGALVKCNCTQPAGEYIFLAPCPPDELAIPRLKKLFINGQEIAIDKKQARYVHRSFARYGLDICLKDGANEIIAEVSLPEDTEINCKKLYFYLQKAEDKPTPIATVRKLHTVKTAEYIRDKKGVSVDGWEEGIGRQISSGRFGFSKGDGLLDCAMTSLGVVDKMFLCGQPKYQKSYRWSYSLLPDDMPLYGTYQPKDKDIEKEDVSVNHLSVRWSVKHKKKTFSCTYSLAAPAILTESDEGTMYLTNLRFAGNYQSVLIPRKDGVEEVSLDSADIQNMAENWVLLFNSTEFPDIPLLLTFDRNPESMQVFRDEKGRLQKLIFKGCPLMLSCTPFGIERFDRAPLTQLYHNLPRENRAF